MALVFQRFDITYLPARIYSPFVCNPCTVRCSSNRCWWL